MGENRWRDEHEWPLKRTRFTPYYLHSSHALNSEKPTAEAADEFSYDPHDPVPSHGGNNLIGASAGPVDQNKIEQRPDVLVYSTEPLENDIEVTGPVTMTLYAASSAKDTDFTAKLVDVHPDGKAYNLCDGIIRGRFRDGRDNPHLLEPGKSEKYDIDLWVTSNLFKRGHRIRVEVSSSNFPRFDRNPNTGHPFGSDADLIKASQTVYHDADRASHLLLPIISPRP
jgi:putative CocE/NonD family hydrolase